MLVKTSVVLCLWSLLCVRSDGLCQCHNTDGGTHCGQKRQMSDCLKDHLYQCNGQFESEAHDYGLCIYGCVEYAKGKDYCPLEEGHCICLNSCGGRHCGQSILMGDKCLTNHIYQCSGKYGSVGHHFGVCRDGCVIDGCSLDFCRIK